MRARTGGARRSGSGARARRAARRQRRGGACTLGRGGGGAGVMMTEGYCIVGLYLCSRPWGRRCFRSRTGGARGAECGLRAQRREGAGGRERAA